MNLLHSLSDIEKARLSVSLAFLKGRLAERETIEWAVKYGKHDSIPRMAIERLLDDPSLKLSEPWLSSWRLLEEYWNAPEDEQEGLLTYRIERCLKQGDRSGALIKEIVDAITPRVKIEPFSDRIKGQKNGRPRRAEDLFFISLTSNQMGSPANTELLKVKDRRFLLELANATDAALNKGLDIIDRLGRHRSWYAMNVKRVYHVGNVSEDNDGDPDRYSRGIAPAVKLLYATITSIAKVNTAQARRFMSRFSTSEREIYIRLWAALAANYKELATSAEVGAFLSQLKPEIFWNLNSYPEIAELRATRFSTLSAHSQRNIIRRLKKGPPYSMWRGGKDIAVEEARMYWAIREFRRIESVGGQFPERTQQWINDRIKQHPDLAGHLSIDSGFLDGIKIRHLVYEPDNTFDSMIGIERLKALEAQLAQDRKHWDDDPSARARAWIDQQGNASHLLQDLEALPANKRLFPMVWGRIFWAHKPSQHDTTFNEGVRVLLLIDKLPKSILIRIIDDVTNWIDVWSEKLCKNPLLLKVWLKLWPLATFATNAASNKEEELDIYLAVDEEQNKPKYLDTLNNPTGRLISAFVSVWIATKSQKPFAKNSALQVMRDKIIVAHGHAGLIAKHKLVELLEYFHNACPKWTNENLFPLLAKNNAQSVILWRALSRRRIYRKTITLLGNKMLSRANDLRLGRESRKSLVFSIVVETMHAYLNKKAPPLPKADIQQLLRSLDDEVRAYAAEAIYRFIRDMTGAKHKKIVLSAAGIFQQSAVKFLKEVWPQERSLSTPSISQALADIPAASGDAFAEAVEVIKRFLVPFRCWSLLDYGLYGNEDEGEQSKLQKRIDTPEKGLALLVLLDLTIGNAEDVTVPHDLGEALAHLESLSSGLTATPEYRRLQTLAQ